MEGLVLPHMSDELRDHAKYSNGVVIRLSGVDES
jgi:hypothetical protein